MRRKEKKERIKQYVSDRINSLDKTNFGTNLNWDNWSNRVIKIVFTLVSITDLWKQREYRIVYL